MTRKQFLKLSAAVGGVIALPTGFINLVRGRSSGANANQFSFRIRPLPNRNYSESFLRLCQRARFRSVTQALASVRSRDLEFEIYRIARHENFVRPGRPDTARPVGPARGNKPRATFFDT